MTSQPEGDVRAEGTLAAAGAGFADGYGNGALAGALIAGLLALIAAWAIPSFRPVAAHQAAMP